MKVVNGGWTGLDDHPKLPRSSWESGYGGGRHPAALKYLLRWVCLILPLCAPTRLSARGRHE